MRIGYINADYGVPVLGGKGSSVHVKEMVNAFSRLGHDVTLFHTRLGSGTDAPEAELISASVGAGQPGQVMRVPAAKRDRYRKELGWIEAAIAIERQLVAEHNRAPIGLLNERYSLWSCAGPRLAQKLDVPCVLEVNAPLVSEALTFREIADIDFARAIEVEAFQNNEIRR